MMRKGRTYQRIKNPCGIPNPIRLCSQACYTIRSTSWQKLILHKNYHQLSIRGEKGEGRDNEEKETSETNECIDRLKQNSESRKIESIQLKAERNIQYIYYRKGSKTELQNIISKPRNNTFRTRNVMCLLIGSLQKIARRNERKSYLFAVFIITIIAFFYFFHTSGEQLTVYLKRLQSYISISSDMYKIFVPTVAFSLIFQTNFGIRLMGFLYTRMGFSFSSGMLLRDL